RTEVSGTRRALTHAIHRHVAIISQIGDHLGVVLLMNTSSRHRARAPLLAKHAPDVSHSTRRRTRVPKTRNPPRSRVFCVCASQTPEHFTGSGGQCLAAHYRSARPPGAQN